MNFKACTILIFVIASSLAFPEVSIKVTKSRWLFVKWADFTPSLNSGSGLVALPDSTISKWYVFADYFTKIGANTIATSVNVKVDGATEYTTNPVVATLAADSETIELNPTVDVKVDCKKEEVHHLAMDSVILVDNVFHVNVTISCQPAKIEGEVVKAATQKEVSAKAATQKVATVVDNKASIHASKNDDQVLNEVLQVEAAFEELENQKSVIAGQKQPTIVEKKATLVASQKNAPALDELQEEVQIEEAFVELELQNQNQVNGSIQKSQKIVEPIIQQDEAQNLLGSKKIIL
jgi:hypothetical protein